MEYEIYWTFNAINDLDKNLEYLQNNWSYREVDSFKRTLREYLRIISLYPLAFPMSNKLVFELRYAVVTKQTTIVYRIVNSKTIHIIRLLDNRSEV